MPNICNWHGQLHNLLLQLAILILVPTVCNYQTTKIIITVCPGICRLMYFRTVHQKSPFSATCIRLLQISNLSHSITPVVPCAFGVSFQVTCPNVITKTAFKRHKLFSLYMSLFDNYFQFSALICIP